MEDSIDPRQNDQIMLNADVPDEMLERAAGHMKYPNPTVPGGIICIPFETP